jgi:hypothetical protein
MNDTAASTDQRFEGVSTAMESYTESKKDGESGARAFLRPENMITGPLSAARPVVGALNGSAAKYCRFPLPRRAHKKNGGRFSPPPFT